MTAKYAALRLLAIKSRSITELRKKLIIKGYSSSEIDQAIEDCLRMGYLNDEEESLRRFEKWKRRGYGPRMIGYKLKEAGLKTRPLSHKQQVDLIRDLIKKTTWAKKPREKLISALQRRGFDLEAILAVIHKKHE